MHPTFSKSLTVALALWARCITLQAQENMPPVETTNAPHPITFTNTLTNLPPAIVTNAPVIPTNTIATNRIFWTTNLVLTNQSFYYQETNALPYYPPPPKKPWWRRFWDWLF